MAPSAELSEREWEVVNQLLEGKSNKQIASSLHITIRTVEYHLKKVYEKLQVSSRAELILKLGFSTVAGQGNPVDNKGRFNFSNWLRILREAVARYGKELKMKSTMDLKDADGIPSMTFYESIRVCFVKFAEFRGRASRSEFWWFALFVVLLASAFTLLNETVGEIFLIAILLPFLAAGSRRLHDIGKSSWWLLFLLAPVAGIVVVGILWAQPPVDALPDDSVAA